MQQLACRRCGAALTVPDDLWVSHVKCQFCGDATALPPELVAVRQAQQRAVTMHQAQQQAVAQHQETQKQVARGIGVMLFVFIGGPILLVIGIIVFVLWIIHDATKGMHTSSSTPVTHEDHTVAPPPPPPPRTIPTDSKSTGEDRTTAELKDLQKKGCTVIAPPKQAQGERSMQTKFVVGAKCVRVLANTGVADNKLTLTLKNPLGEKIKTPDPTTELDFTFCPKMSGEHPMTLSPATEDYFTLAAMECPAGVK